MQGHRTEAEDRREMVKFSPSAALGVLLCGVRGDFAVCADCGNSRRAG